MFKVAYSILILRSKLSEPVCIITIRYSALLLRYIISTTKYLKNGVITFCQTSSCDVNEKNVLSKLFFSLNTLVHLLHIELVCPKMYLPLKQIINKLSSFSG